MPTPPSFWPGTLVDYAQILSAIATAAAVMVSLWIALRQERERIGGYLGCSLLGEENRLMYINVKVINIGLRPLTIEAVYADIPSGRGKWRTRRYSTSFVFLRHHIGADNDAEALEFGQNIIFKELMIPDTLQSISTMEDARNVRFRVVTTTGKTKTFKLEKHIAAILFNTITAHAGQNSDG
jgi:hypothetical protein